MDSLFYTKHPTSKQPSVHFIGNLAVSSQVGTRTRLIGLNFFEHQILSAIQHVHNICSVLKGRAQSQRHTAARPVVRSLWNRPLHRLQPKQKGTITYTPFPNHADAAKGQEPMPTPIPAARPFNTQLFAFKALGFATLIVGVVAVCSIKATTWYMDVHNVLTPVPTL
jgi:hypothetical protein